MSEWYVSQKQQSSNLSKLLQERMEKSNPRHKLTADESKRLAKLETIADKLKRGENVQNRQLQTWLSVDEYEQKNVYGLSTFFVLHCASAELVNY